MAGSVITAGTTRTQAGATLITADITTINTSTAPSAGSMLGDGVALPVVGSGTDRIFLINNTANPVQLYGSGSDTVNGVAASTGIILAPNSAVVCVEAAPGAWGVVGSGLGYSASFSTGTALNGITAHAGGGQGSATLLTAEINRVTTVATAADSVLMPVSAPGMTVTVTNAAASNSMNVFPQSGDAINALGANAAFAVAAGKTATFTCAVAGQWHAVLTA